jgi:hypothetical protein
MKNVSIENEKAEIENELNSVNIFFLSAFLSLSSLPLSLLSF